MKDTCKGPRRAAFRWPSLREHTKSVRERILVIFCIVLIADFFSEIR